MTTPETTSRSSTPSPSGEGLTGEVVVSYAREHGEEAPPAALVRRRADIQTMDHANAAAFLLRRVRQRIREIRAHWKEVREPLNAALKRFRDMEHEDVAQWEAADRVLAPALLEWQVREDQRVKREAARLLTEAEDRARAEQAEQAAALEAAAAVAGTKTQQRELTRQAKAVRRAPVLPTSVAVVPSSKVEGVHVTYAYAARVDDLEALVKAVAKGKAPLAALAPDQAWLDGQADALRSEFAIPGVSVVEKPIQTARSLK